MLTFIVHIESGKKRNRICLIDLTNLEIDLGQIDKFTILFGFIFS